MQNYLKRGIMLLMHKNFYASGFLYHGKSAQILLQQKNSAEKNSPWSLFGEKAIKNKSGEETFRDIFSEQLSIKLKLHDINSIYTYSPKEGSKNHNIYYAKVKKLYKPSCLTKTEFAWFNFKKIQKLNLSEQTKQDIIVGWRVIDSSIRKSLGQKTIG